MKQKLFLLKTINHIFVDVSKNGLSKPVEDVFNNELLELSVFFKSTKIEAFFMVLIFGATHKRGQAVNLSVLSELLKWSSIQILEYDEVLEDLIEKQYLVKTASNLRRRGDFPNYSYMLNSKITESIIKNKAMPDLRQKKFDSVIDVFEELYFLSEELDNNLLGELTFITKLKAIISRNSHFGIFKKMKQLGISDKFQFIYYNVIWKTLVGEQSFTIENLANRMKISIAEKIKFTQDFVDPTTNKLLKHDLINIYLSEFINDSVVGLSDKSIKILESENVKISFDVKKDRPKGVILPKDINKTNLFFAPKESKQLAIIQSALMPKKYKELQKRLKDKNLPTGLTVMFFGHSGTGKTESVLQLAKKSGRAVMQVDISQTKSKWYGDSEKLIKRVFTDYYKFKAQEKKVPILLFNEADAIISKRKEIGSSNLAQTENSIQNIILEELEKFEGIFIATTNLVKNIDAAFERRFLFKVELMKPSTDVIAKIWKAKLKSLNLGECRKLAQKFDLTGGEINNIVRKAATYEVVNNEAIKLNILEDFCTEERFLKRNHNIMGFTA